MLEVHVTVHIKPDQIDEFKAASIANAHQTVLEPGIVRFAVLQQADDPTEFRLVEVYRSGEDPSRHLESPHFKRWQAEVQHMLAEPGGGAVYNTVFPPDED